ncbi:tRNA(Ile)-lysidine synthase [Brevundimonas alba]|uniref:tRNA(Ile)-lysidine synthetase n=1 Tax=Brevundimonas alba TaxID=74314 RepID=A0A7X5YK67_9CAUL|nr:tRNA lysidine(34) synthetase TilS [Brevundimonas alba]NJC40194.1 tRNA(Ile)-lysidine synthase [Brevundimonas alba]
MALSGGGDSVALLHAAAGWTRDHGRRLLALTVDHGLCPDSARWTDFARDAAHAAGADWQGLSWEGPKPAAGLPAAARAARHRLIADAARQAGARVILFAHTAGDVAEGELMRAEGSTLGRLRDWSPSPVWPECRGLMLLRPMLDVARADLRDWLTAQGLSWIDDPANEDPKYARSRARLSLLPSGTAGDPAVGPTRMRGPLPLPAGEGSFLIDRSIAPHALAATLVCAGGGDRPPRGGRLDRLLQRLGAGESFTATLCGARIEASPDQVLVTREPGEFSRHPSPPLPLLPGGETVWDGRWLLTASEPGWSVAPAAGRLASLSGPDRARLAALPPPARATRPVLIRHGAPAPVLASPTVTMRSLVEQRLAFALDRMTHETELEPRADGATPRNHLFLALNC